MSLSIENKSSWLIVCLMVYLAALALHPGIAAAQAPLEGTGSGLVGWWKFDEGTGTTVYDSSGNGHTGAFVNSPTWVAGRIGGWALSFDGVSSFVRIPSSTDFDFNLTHEYTISAWVYPKDVSRVTAVARAMDNDWHLWQMEQINGTRFDLEYVHRVVSTGASRAMGSGLGYTTNAWHHVVGVKTTAGVVKIFVDAVEGTDSSPISNPDPDLSGVNLAIGSRRSITPDSIWNGYIDDVRIYNRALSSAEVGILYNGGPLDNSHDLPLGVGGAATIGTPGSAGTAQAGYATLAVNSGNNPYGTAFFGFKQNGATVTEAGVPASPPTTRARIFIDYRTAVNAVPGRGDAGTVDINTGIAVVNNGTVAANVTYTLRNVNGGLDPIARGSGTIAAGHHFARFIDALQDVASGFSLPPNFQTAIQFASLEIDSDQPLSVLALRGVTNQRKEFLITTTPIADLTDSLSYSPIYFPQFADGGGYTTSVILLNTSGNTETGVMEIRDDLGSSLSVSMVGGQTGSSFSYSIPAGGVIRFQTDGSPAQARAGWARLTPDAGTSTPIGSGVFSYNPDSYMLSESGIPSAVPTTHARIYVDLSGSHNTGLAIADASGAGASITVNAFSMDGFTPIGPGQGPIQLASNGYKAQFADAFVTGLPAGFTGVLDISSETPFAALTLRSLNNERREFLMTTFPVADTNQIPSLPIMFPHIVDGGGYTTEFILISSGEAASTTLRLYDESGSPFIW
jgi:hypothetical protein